MTQPKYKINKEVKVQLLNFIVTGTVEQIQERVTHYNDGSSNPHVKYWIKTITGGHIMTPYETDLDFVQDLPLGEME